MEKMVMIRLRDCGVVCPYKANDFEVKEGDFVIVEHDRGLDYGQAVCPKECRCEEKVEGSAEEYYPPCH